MSQWDQSSKLSLSLLYSRWRAWGVWLHFFDSHLVLPSKFSLAFIECHNREVILLSRDCHYLSRNPPGHSGVEEWESMMTSFPLSQGECPGTSQSPLCSMVHVYLPNLTCPFHTHGGAVQNDGFGVEEGPPPFHFHSGEQRMAYAQLLSSSTWDSKRNLPKCQKRGQLCLWPFWL